MLLVLKIKAFDRISVLKLPGTLYNGADEQ
jgi:hypothetical protein